MNTEYLKKRLWNLGYTIENIQEATYIQDELEHELFNIMFAHSNPTNEELIEALEENNIYKKCRCMH